MSEMLVRLPDHDVSFPVRINGADPTFQLQTQKVHRTASEPIDPLMQDFLDIATTVFAADSQVTRGGSAGSGMGEAWRRRFVFTIPVIRYDVWSRSDVQEALVSLIGFMSGDAPSFEFLPREPEQVREPFLDLDPDGATLRADDVILFSGGLDSFAGALETLSTSAGKVLLVSHQSAQKVLPRQNTLAKFLAKNFKGRCLHIGVKARLKNLKGRETTQRTRTLLFAALAHCVAQAFGARRISFFENGIVSHNLPISPQVIGTMATRTTHPLVLQRLNDLLVLIAPDAPPIINGYEWMTKREVLDRIVRFGGKAKISEAVSCAIVREQTILHTHCGTCSQCLDRRFAILAAGLADEDPIIHYKVDVLRDAIPIGRKRVMALEWTRHAIEFQEARRRDLLTKYGQEISRICRGHPDMTSEEVIDRTLEMHRRHAENVHAVLIATIKDEADRIVARRIDPASLMMLHIGAHSADPRLLEMPPPELPPLEPLPSNDRDITLDPNGPLKVAFYFEEGIPMISVEGLCRLRGSPAKVAHSLKVVFDQDRAAGLKPDSHRYVPVHTHPDCQMTKEMARQAVRRCRKGLAEAFFDLNGVQPSSHLLIQSRSPEGYRLDPLTRIVTTDRIK